MERSLNAGEMMAIRIALLAEKESITKLVRAAGDPHSIASYRARLEVIRSLTQTFRPGQQIRVEA